MLNFATMELRIPLIRWVYLGLGLAQISFCGCAQSWGKFWQLGMDGSSGKQPVDNTGTAVWARSTASGAVYSAYMGVALRPSGDVYAAGEVGMGTTNFGVTSVSGPAPSNVGVVGYTPAGTDIWSRTATTAGNLQKYAGVTANSSGIFAMGNQTGNTTNNYGAVGVTSLSGPANPNALILAYGSGGAEAWGLSPNPAPDSSQFLAGTADASGSLFVCGFQFSNATFGYGGQNATATGGNNAVLIRMDTAGNVSWASTVSAGTNNSEFAAVATDATGNIYAAGYQFNTGTYTYGSQSISGASSGNNATLVKYNSAGTALWARTPTVAANVSQFTGVATDQAGNIYAVGFQTGNTAYTYAGQSVTGAYAGGINALIVKFNSAGNAVWAGTTTTAANTSRFNAVATDALGNIYAAGYVSGSGTFNFGGISVTAPHAAGTNAVIVKYSSTGNVAWVRTLISAPNASEFTGIAISDQSLLYAVGSQTNNGSFSYGSGASVTGGHNSGTNAVIVKYE